MAVSHSYFQRDGLAATGYVDDYAYAKAAKQSSKARPEFAYSRSANPFLAPPPSLKACTQCGTTRTPQWREGPEGPKTLCNACGVKRVRAMRLATGEAPPKRRSSGDRSMAHTLPPKTLAALSLGKQSSGSLTSDSIGRKRARSPSASGRPQRKAAAKAASRTAEFATTGDWSDEEEAMYPNSPLERSLSPSASEDSAALNSDSAEEVAWTPTRGPAYHPAVPLPPSPMPMVGHETAAAVNLLSMSIREADLAASRAAAAGAHMQRSTPPALTAEQHQQMAAKSPCNLSSPGFAAMLSAAVNSSAAAVRENDQHSAEQAREALQDTLRSLPANKQIDMRVLKEAYDSSLREAAAADAAVAAVAKILAIKQAAAIKARAGASVAANAMHSWMMALDEEYSWTRASRPKHERA